MPRRLPVHRPLLIAHRGCPRFLPENTLAGFRLAFESGADLVETDIWATADGVLVCHHDRTLDRVTDRRGAIPELLLAEVKQATVRRSEYATFEGGEPVPMLLEVLAVVPPDRGMVLELKDPRLAEPALMSDLVTMLLPRIADGSVMLLSFQEDLLWAARRVDPRVWIARIDEHEPRPRFAGDGIGTTPLAMAENDAYMDEARAQGLWVCPLDPEPELRLGWYENLGVDALLSDDVARTLEAVLDLDSWEGQPVR